MSDNLTLEEKQFANVEASLTPGRPLPYPEVGFPTSEEKERPKWYSMEAGRERRRRLEETLSYYTPPELQSALGLVDVLNPISALEDAGTQTQVALDSSRPKEERLEALTDAAINLGLAVVPAGLASRGYMRAAPAIMESLVGVSPSGTSDIVEEVTEDLAKPRRGSRRPSVKPLFMEAELSEQRALMPNEGQRVAEFYSPTEELLKDLPIPTKGIRGADILKAIEKEPTIRRQEVEAFGLDIDPQRRYTAEEVEQFVTRNPYRVEAQRPTEFDYTGRYIFQDTQRLELKPNEVQDISYDETIIRAIPAENKAGFVAAMGTHHTPDTIAHVRSSVKNVPSISDRDIYLIEEIQSDLVARGARPVRGEITYDEALETGAKDTIDRLKERFKDLPSSAEIETNKEFLTDLYRFTVTSAAPERLKEFPTAFGVDPSKLMLEKYGVDHMDLAISYLEKRNIPRNTAVQLVKNIRDAAVEFAYTPPTELTKAVGPAPIKDINEVARLGLQTAIADALSNGQTKVVIPNLEQIVASGRARPGSTEWDNMTKPGSSFHRMYVTGMQKAIDQIKKDLPDISVDTKVEFPFEPRAYYVPYLKDPIDLDNTVTILDLSAYEGKNLSRLRFADGGTVSSNVVDERGRPLVSRRPKERPDFDAPRYTDPVLRGEDGRVITIVDETNPVTQLGQTMGDSFRVYEPRSLNARGVYVPPVSLDSNLEVLGGPTESEINTYYKKEYPNRGDINVNDVVIMGEGLDNSQTVAHEFMHRGFNLIRETFSEQKLKDRYGETIAGIIHNPRYEHYLVQAVLENEGQHTSNDYNANLTDEGKEVVKSVVEPLYELAREASGERGFITDRDRGPSSRPNNKPTEKESFIGSIKKALGFAEGGLSMDNEMEMLMSDGGLRDDGMDTDPISGNEVPYGSLAEEVRDDIPAQLSEGEYVVPADVVRFFGVKYFEDLRKYAKMSLEEMEMNGRIGGEPVMNKGGFPSKAQTRGMQAGGVATNVEALEKYRTFDPSKFVTPGQSYIKRAAELQGNTPVISTPEITYVEYVSADGTNTLIVPFISGEPQVQIPEGYVTLEEFNKTEAQDSTQISKVDVRGNQVNGSQASESKEAGTSGWESDTDFGNFTNEDWLNWSDKQGNNFLSTGILSGGIIGTVSQLDSVADMRSGIAIASMYGASPETINEMKSKLSNYESRLSGFEKRIDQSPLIPTSGYKQVINHFKAKGINLSDKEINTIKTLMEDGSLNDSDLKQIRILGGTRADVGGGLTEDQFDSPEEFKQSMKDVAPDGMDYNEETGSYTRKDQSSIWNAAKDAGYTEEITNEGVRVFENTGNVTPTSSVVRPVSRPTTTTTASTASTTTTTPTSSVVRPVSRPTTTTTPSTTTTTPTSSRTLSDVQREINKALEESGGVWTSELNDLVKERESLGGYGGS